MIGKSFKITDPKALVRDNQFQPVRNANGTFRLIPAGTLVTVEDYNVNGLRRLDYVKVQDFGWTARSNFEFGLLNEVLRNILPGFFSQDPAHHTVIDDKALIRKKTGKEFPATKVSIPLGALLVAKQSSADNKYVQIAFTHKVDNDFAEDASRKPVWTKASNLSPGWFDPRGVNSLWKKGRFLGLKPLVAVVGSNGELKNVVQDTFDFYIKMADAARKKGVGIELTSAFRTWEKQEELYQNFLKNRGNLAAKPGHSNHQNGIAFDLNTGREPVGPVYNWLHAHAAEFGFIRTVPSEAWHWEFRPDLAQGGGSIQSNTDPDSAGDGE